jgi:hypothetical protein
MICPLVGGVAMLYVVWTLWDNPAFAAVLAANSLVFQAGPYFILAVFVTGVVYACGCARPNRMCTARSAGR